MYSASEIYRFEKVYIPNVHNFLSHFLQFSSINDFELIDISQKAFLQCHTLLGSDYDIQ